MPPPNITTALANDQDGPTLASIMTAAFSASDATYPLIWGGAPEGTHDQIATIGLFAPVQQEGRVTYKAVDETTGEVVGFATWGLPKAGSDEDGEGKDGEGTEGGKEKKDVELPELPGVNMQLWRLKFNGMREFRERDINPHTDMFLFFLFVHPTHQCRGIGSLLLSWGKIEADSRQRGIWLAATPQARVTYEKNGWVVKENLDIDLSQHGGVGTYSRSWMCREPRVEM